MSNVDFGKRFAKVDEGGGGQGGIKPEEKLVVAKSKLMLGNKTCSSKVKLVIAHELFT